MPAFPPVTTYTLPVRSGNEATEKAFLTMAGCLYEINIECYEQTSTDWIKKKFILHVCSGFAGNLGASDPWLCIYSYYSNFFGSMTITQS